MPDISATDAARKFSDLLDEVEHRGTNYTIVRRGRAVAHLEPIARARAADVKKLLTAHTLDREWSEDLIELRSLLDVEERR